MIRESSAVVTWDALPIATCPPVLLVQVFQNLISNAIRYSRPGEVPRVHVRAGRSAGDWIVTVRDNGIGIEPQYRERIFGVFKRLSAGGPGTGIGLAICKAAVERWGGRIWVADAPESGSDFCFTAAGEPAPTAASAAEL